MAHDEREGTVKKQEALVTLSHSQGAEREECWPSDCFSLLIYCKTLPPSVVPPTVRVGLPHSVKPVCDTLLDILGATIPWRFSLPSSWQ